MVGIVVCDWEAKRKWRVIRMLYNSEKREHESISGAYVQAKIIRKEDKKFISESGTVAHSRHIMLIFTYPRDIEYVF